MKKLKRGRIVLHTRDEAESTRQSMNVRCMIRWLLKKNVMMKRDLVLRGTDVREHRDIG